MKISKNRKNLVKDFDFGKVYEPKDAIKILKNNWTEILFWPQHCKNWPPSLQIGIDAHKKKSKTSSEPLPLKIKKKKVSWKISN